jgi:hypothetical protein
VPCFSRGRLWPGGATGVRRTPPARWQSPPAQNTDARNSPAGTATGAASTNAVLVAPEAATGGIMLMSLDRSAPEPLRDQLADLIRSKIADGTWPTRTAIPSITSLASDYGIAVITLLRTRSEVSLRRWHCHQASRHRGAGRHATRRPQAASHVADPEVSSRRCRLLESIRRLQHFPLPASTVIASSSLVT